jgi:ABC-type multidrug transport system fused ATPase/permease subunit
MEHGKIAAYGTYHELLDKSDKFIELVKRQMIE